MITCMKTNCIIGNSSADEVNIQLAKKKKNSGVEKKQELTHCQVEIKVVKRSN